MRLLQVLSRSVRVRPPRGRRAAVPAAAVVSVLALSLAGGCQAPPKATPPPPPTPKSVSPQQAAGMQQSLMAALPGARVGRVVQVDEAGLVAVAGLSPAEVKPGMTVSFYDGDNHVIANGHAFDLSTTAPSATYLIVDGITPEMSAGFGRMPKVGDAVIFLGAEANR